MGIQYSVDRIIGFGRWNTIFSHGIIGLGGWE